MRIFVLNTGTELLLGDVRDAHLSFIAQQILELGQRILEQRTVEMVVPSPEPWRKSFRGRT